MEQVGGAELDFTLLQTKNLLVIMHQETRICLEHIFSRFQDQMSLRI